MRQAGERRREGCLEFRPIHLTVPDHVLVQNENMAVSLAALSKYLYEADKDAVRGNGV